MSLDGYIARKNGSIDWLMKFNDTVPSGEDCGFKNFLNEIDLIIMGRNTFEQVLTFGSWPYGNKKMVVLSSTLKKVPTHLEENVSIENQPPKDLLEKISYLHYRNIYIDGGITIQSFLKQKLINTFTITTIPIIIGDGIPLFGNIKDDIGLKLIESRS